jgi:hypothetical protein
MLHSEILFEINSEQDEHVFIALFTFDFSAVIVDYQEKFSIKVKVNKDIKPV